MTLNYKFRRSETTVSGELNQNLARIADHIDAGRTRVQGEEDSTFRVTDILKAEVVVPKASDMIEAYNTLKKIKCFQIVRIKNELETYLQTITLNLINQRTIVGEIVLRCGAKPAIFEGGRFLT